MPIPVEMPKMSDTMEEGVLVAWLAEEGQQVSSGDVIAQVETDKATMDLEVYDDGVLLKRVVAEGASVPIGALIAVLGKAGEDPASVLSEYGGDGASTPAPAPAAGDADKEEGETKAEAAPAAPAASGDGASAAAAPAAPEAPAVEARADDGGRVKASPLARRMAQEQGLDLGSVSGSGPEGRIVRRDVEAAAGGASAKQEAKTEAPKPAEAPRATPRPAAAPAVAGDDYTSTPISQMRRTIARRLAQSKFTAPHFYLTVEVDMERAVAVREQLNTLSEAQGGARISYNDLVTKSCAVALRAHPAVNSSYLEEEGEIRRHHGVHVAIAVAVDEGLLTPVIRDADRKGLAEIAQETRALAERARAKKLEPSDWEGSTFTTSNLGMFGIQEFTAIINPPNACILAIGAMRDVPVVKDGAVVPGKRMTVTLSCDHRVVDGATGAAFLADVKRLIEEPVGMLL